MDTFFCECFGAFFPFSSGVLGLISIPGPPLSAAPRGSPHASQLSAYSLVALVFTLLAWFDAFEHADIIRVANKSELVLSTVAAGLGLFTSVIG